jgi:hypothetical protein
MGYCQKILASTTPKAPMRPGPPIMARPMVVTTALFQIDVGAAELGLNSASGQLHNL